MPHRSRRSRADQRRTHHRSRGRSRRVLALSLGLGGTLSAGAALLGVSFAATAPSAQPLAQPDPNCTLTVPANPLTAQGLATPYQLTATDPAKGPCHEADPNQSAFVQATVLDPATGALSVYNPLVVDRGTTPAVAAVVPALPANAVVGIWFGFNGGVLSLRGHTADGSCVGGAAQGAPFGQFAYCNAPAFFTAANTAEQAGKLTVPPLGTAKDGKPCLTTRDFGLVDQDQSDNVTTEYLADARGRTAQKTAKNSAALGHNHPRTMRNASTTLLNGSDNLLLVNFEDPALGCTPWTAPDLADPGASVTSLALNELQAAKFQASPVALVPLNDPMVTENNKQNRDKTNRYRAGVDQPPLGAGATGDPKTYCTQLATLGARRIRLDRRFTVGAASPQAGQNLFDFLTQRLAASLTNLNCPAAARAALAAPDTTAPDPTATGTTAPDPTATDPTATGPAAPGAGTPQVATPGAADPATGMPTTDPTTDPTTGATSAAPTAIGTAASATVAPTPPTAGAPTGGASAGATPSP
ncbi:hypothetical protein ACFW1A_04880 [Kitasatospora sp. NPDC058965]|uniref:hypothetical protein n=1 Tax=Kitasatospora sp. NPDC058965 TaxID=3346682 RepID=UPI003694D3E0